MCQIVGTARCLERCSGCRCGPAYPAAAFHAGSHASMPALRRTCASPIAPFQAHRQGASCKSHRVHSQYLLFDPAADDVGVLPLPLLECSHGQKCTLWTHQVWTIPLILPNTPLSAPICTLLFKAIPPLTVVGVKPKPPPAPLGYVVFGAPQGSACARHDS